MASKGMSIRQSVRRRKAQPVVIPVHVGVHTDDLIENIVQSLSFDQIHDFIVKLDKACEDWGVTEKLHNYFASEMDKLPSEEA